MKHSIIIPYYNRKPLLQKTLQSISLSKIKDYEVIIIDDASEDEHQLGDIDKCGMNVLIHRIDFDDKWYSNPCIPFNIGMSLCSGDSIILQSPECMHLGDILDLSEQELSDGIMLNLACYALSEKRTAEVLLWDLLNMSPEGLYNKSIEFINQWPWVDGATYSEDGWWFNHEVINPLYYHFCSILTRNDLDALNGFDERYAEGNGFDDNEILERVRRRGIHIKYFDNPFVFHLNHYSYNNNRIVKKDNRAIYYCNTMQEKGYRANFDKIILPQRSLLGE